MRWGRQIALTMVWLVVVCAGAWWLLRLLYSSGGGLGSFTGLGKPSRKLIHVVDRHVLGPQRALLVVEVSGKRLLLGVTEQQIRTLADLGVEAEEGPADPAEPTVSEVLDREGDGENPEVPSGDLAELFGRRSSDPMAQGKGETQR